MSGQIPSPGPQPNCRNAPTEGKLVIPAAEMAAKIRAAADARAQPDFVIIARTDARAVEGLEQALEPGRLAHQQLRRRDLR
jgi:2-methylisocitrate lyase-like PEP mutase family enzyme